jgi:asparagine synthase (glutamine-hydrolysing)
MSYSSGLHERARLFKPLYPRLYRSFGYGLLEPMRRDFDTVLERNGHDLDRAIADGAARPDYTLAERARDLAGAARWNAVLAVQERIPGRLSARSGSGLRGRELRPRAGRGPRQPWRPARPAQYRAAGGPDSSSPSGC